jgi:hypothetical protein
MQPKIQQLIKDHMFALLEGETIEVDTALKGTLYISVSLDGMAQGQQMYWVKINCKSCFHNTYWSDTFLVNEFGEEQGYTRV